MRRDVQHRVDARWIRQSDVMCGETKNLVQLPFN
jgi:hypothetical protein